MRRGLGELHQAFARHALPGRGYVPLPVCLKIVRQTATYDPLRPPFPFLMDLVHALRRLSGASHAAVRGYWAPDSPLEEFHGSHGWVELTLEDGPVIALVPRPSFSSSSRSYPAFVQKTARTCLQEWAEKLR